MRTLTIEKARAVLEDLIGARHDLLQPVQMHGLAAEVLARWVSRAEVRQTLAALCVLSDSQTPWVLSPYRRLAANRLLRMATGEEQAVSEPARKAGVDWLRTELQRVSESDQQIQNAVKTGLDVPAPRPLYYEDQDSVQEGL